MLKQGKFNELLKDQLERLAKAKEFQGRYAFCGAP
jgi:hypothetical protein